MRRLWLHIGSHKTGTTTLQNSLRIANRDGRLGSWTYVHSPDVPNLNGVVSIKGAGSQMRWQIKPAELESRIPSSGDCIMSSERMFWLNSKREIRFLAAILKSRFDDIKVVVYLRRQDSLAVSFRKTAITILPAKLFFGDRISALPDYLPHMDRYFDYSKKLRLWESVFGAENVVVRKYESGQLTGNDTVSDFSSVIGHDVPSIPQRVNKSWSRSQMLVGMWLQSKGYPLKQFLGIVKEIKDDDKLLPSMSDARQFMERFAESNSLLAKRYGPDGPPGYFNDDFSQYPDQRNDDISLLSLDLNEIEERVKLLGVKRERQA